jgi:hypothetical protein
LPAVVLAAFVAFVPIAGACGDGEEDSNREAAPLATTPSTATSTSTSGGNVVAPPPRGASNGVRPEGVDAGDVAVVIELAGNGQVSNGGIVRGEVTVTNTSGRSLELESGCVADGALFFDGERISSDVACTSASGPMTLAPSERRSVPFEVRAVGSDGSALEPGVYDLFVGARVADDPPGVRWGEGVHVLVTG